MKLDTSSKQAFIRSYDATKMILTSKKKQLVEIQENLAASQEDFDNWQQALHEVRIIAEVIQHNIYGQIEELVSQALKFVFGEEYSCQIVTDQKRGKVTAEILLKKGDTLMDPATSCGGGVIDIMAFALRISAVLVDTRQRNRRVLILDEPMKWLSAKYRPLAVQLMSELVEKMDFQLVMVTHDSEFTIGDVVEI